MDANSAAHQVYAWSARMGISLILYRKHVKNAPHHCSPVSLALIRLIAHCVNNRPTSLPLRTHVSIAQMISLVVSAAHHPRYASSVTQGFISTLLQISAASVKCPGVKSVTSQIL